MVLKKTTLLFEEDVYTKLKDRAKRENMSIGGLVRKAVSTYYGIKTKEDKLIALKEIKSLDLLIAGPETIEREILKGALDDR